MCVCVCLCIYIYMNIEDIFDKKVKQMNNLLETKVFLDLTTPSDKSLTETILSMKAFVSDKLALFEKKICNVKAFHSQVSDRRSSFNSSHVSCLKVRYLKQTWF